MGIRYHGELTSLFRFTAFIDLLISGINLIILKPERFLLLKDSKGIKGWAGFDPYKGQEQMI